MPLPADTEIRNPRREADGVVGNLVEVLICLTKRKVGIIAMCDI